MPKYLTDEQQQLVENYHYLIKQGLDLFSLSMDDIEDWYGIAAIALCNAAMSYDASKGEFEKYAIECILISIYDQLYSCREEIKLNTAIDAACRRLSDKNTSKT